MLHEVWLDAEREAGEEIVRVRMPPPRTDGTGHEYNDRMEIAGLPCSLMSLAPWCVAGLAIEGVPPEEDLGIGEIIIIRGCMHIVRVSLGEVRSWKKWLTRVHCPPRQNISFHARYPQRDLDLRVYWKRAHTKPLV